MVIHVDNKVLQPYELVKLFENTIKSLSTKYYDLQNRNPKALLYQAKKLIQHLGALS